MFSRSEVEVQGHMCTNVCHNGGGIHFNGLVYVEAHIVTKTGQPQLHTGVHNEMYDSLLENDFICLRTDAATSQMVSEQLGLSTQQTSLTLQQFTQKHTYTVIQITELTGRRNTECQHGKLDDLRSAALCDISQYLRMADSKLFNRIQSPFHCLSHLLPLEKHHLGLRLRGHRYALPICPNNLCKRSFSPRCLFCF